MPVRKRKTVTANDGTYEGLVLAAFDAAEPGDLDYSGKEPTCSRCDGTGRTVTCSDKYCRSFGKCVHGNGARRCPNCGGEGAL